MFDGVRESGVMKVGVGVMGVEEVRDNVGGDMVRGMVMVLVLEEGVDKGVGGEEVVADGGIGDVGMMGGGGRIGGL